MKKLKTLVQRGGMEALALTGAFRVHPFACPGKGLILTLHHVRPFVPGPCAPNRELEVTPEVTEEDLFRRGPVEEGEAHRVLLGLVAREDDDLRRAARLSGEEPLAETPAEGARPPDDDDTQPFHGSLVHPIDSCRSRTSSESSASMSGQCGAL